MNGRADVPYETLDLPEPARSLFRKTRVALETHVSAYAADGEGYKLGGGTILAVRWKHRRSNDIDVLFHPDTRTSHFEAELGKALEQAGGAPLGWGECSRIEFGESHLDLLKGEPTPSVGHQSASVDGSPVTVLTNVQILNGKLGYRALDPPTRDVYDIAVCGIEDPESLEIVLNGVYEAKRDATILGWKMSEAKHAENAAEQILDAPGRRARTPSRFGTSTLSAMTSRRTTIVLEVAIPWFIGWCVLTGVSWRRYSRVLPGPFSSTHRLCGVVTYAGFWFTCITGVAMYVLCYAF